MRDKFVSVREAVRQTGQTEAKIRALIQQGKIRVERVGYHILIPRVELRKLQPAKAVSEN
jgi:excisionase family DNA binding protein